MAKNSEITERFSTMLEFLELNPAQLSKRLGYGRAQTIYDIEKGRSNPSFDFFYRFIDAGFAEKINIEWLIYGRGDMKAKPQQQEESYEGSPISGHLIQYMREKDEDIKTMAEEIGRLKTTIESFQKAKYRPGSGNIDQAAEPEY